MKITYTEEIKIKGKSTKEAGQTSLVHFPRKDPRIYKNFKLLFIQCFPLHYSLERSNLSN